MNSPIHFDAARSISRFLESRLSREAYDFSMAASNEIKRGASAQRVAHLLAFASRHVRASIALDLDSDEMRVLKADLPHCNPAHWSLLETIRIVLLLSSAELVEDSFPALFEYCFRFADHGESCALYRALPLLPRGERFVRRAEEGCRTNMRTVFEAVACDSPYPATHFDDPSWRQLVIKAVFIDAPLSRIDSLDARLSPELARMALDLADERRSAGRDVPPQLWHCLGAHAGARGLDMLRKELRSENRRGRRGALLALARAGALTRADPWIRAAEDEHRAFIVQAREYGFDARALHLL
ncbi:EboA domain-containing protein [Burkholderia sp. MSMB1589WGS]|uniref:EboA domain-containing protein n=1 Tax=Burkholderia sp. MSMB1589WGS TaxID=1636425 RepID=UPI000A3DE9EE|nr:EboA domain-containing protein [Burkholderia sp. MSMB1589WGS]